jgi:signal transduction histidine kinase/ActR/RegA family two-component response regulator
VNANVNRTASARVADAEASASPRYGLTVSLIGVSLLLAFAAVFWAQMRTLRLLESSVADRNDSLTFAFTQLEYEHLKLGESLRLHVAAPSAVALDDIRMRYELFVSRVQQLETGARDMYAVIGHPGDPLKAALRAMVTLADPVLGEAAQRVPDEAELRALLARLDALAQPLHDLALDAYHTDSERIGHTDDAFREHYLLALTLTGFQTLLTVIMAALLVNQLRQAERKRRALLKLTDELRQAQHEAESASRAKTAFVANMSHELRTPFHGLLGMLALLAQSRLQPEQQRLLRTARASGEHLMSILNDVLDVSKLDAGSLHIDARNTALLRLLDDVHAIMLPLARHRNLSFELDVRPRVPARVVVDAVRLRQILFNLVGNAIKFTKRGGVTIVVDWDLMACRGDDAAAASGAAPLDGDTGAIPGAGVPARRPGQLADHLLVQVIDTGIGMDEATMGRLFQRFAQGDDSIQRRFGGTGLGLEISRTLARRMGGDIGAQSLPGQGSTFSLCLPLEAVDEVEAVPSEAQQLTQPAELLMSPVRAGLPAAGPATRPALLPRSEPQANERLRVLVCDDNEVNRLLMQAYLEGLAGEVVMCEDGAQAVALVRCNAFDLVMMDVHMPVLDGFAATREIRALMPREDGPVVVAVTADPLEDTRIEARAAGIDDVLPKPVDAAQVEACVRRLFPTRA